MKYVKRFFLAVTVLTVGGFVWWAGMNYTGYCHAEGRYLSDEEKIKSAVQYIVNRGSFSINKEKNIFEAGEELTQVSIFLSPLNVHVNRIPLTGEVKYLNYIKGDYIVAFDHKSSERNERTEIGIEDTFSGKKILFKQIAGFVARRIVYEIKCGDKVIAGDRFGMIKFGSRVDILIRKTSRVLVELNQKVTGGETIIAEL